MLVFFLVPLYTAVLSTAEYGTYDIVISTITLLIPIFTFNISDGVLRFSMDDDLDVVQVAHIGIGVVLLSSIFVTLLTLTPFTPWRNIDGIEFVALIYFFTAMHQVLICLARGLEKMKLVALAGIISAVFLVGFNIVFLLCLNMGLFGFYSATVISYGIPVLFLLFAMRNILFFKPVKKKKKLVLSMVRYSFPLAATVLGWWLINTSDKYIVLYFCGSEANGLYSIAYQIPAILNTIAGIFLQAWQVTAVKEFDKNDTDGFLLQVFNIVEMIMVLACSLMIILSPVFADFLFSGDFYLAWIFVPLLLVYAVLNTMSGMWAPFFSVNLDSKPIAISTFLGGLVNIILGIPLVFLLGIYGAVLSSVVAGFVNWVYRGLKSRKYIVNHFHLKKSFCLYLLLVIQATVMMLNTPSFFSIILQFAIFFSFIFCFRKNMKSGFYYFRSIVKRGDN